LNIGFKNTPIFVMPTLNQEFRIVFQPKNPSLFEGRRRFAIGAGQIAKYLGEENAGTAILKALCSYDDSYTKKFRAHGDITFYRK
jgi:hypothetical protein